MLRQAHIYLPVEDRPAILVPLYDTGGPFVCEQETSTVLSDWRDFSKLGASVLLTVKKFAVKQMQIRGGGKPRDNPTFRASGCGTVREFESAYLCIRVCARDRSELFFDAFTKPHYEADIELRTTLNPCGLDVEIGRKLVKLVDACKKWSEHVAQPAGCSERRAAV
jgi:hypothetical protein